VSCAPRTGLLRAAPLMPFQIRAGGSPDGRRAYCRGSIRRGGGPVLTGLYPEAGGAGHWWCRFTTYMAEIDQRGAEISLLSCGHPPPPFADRRRAARPSAACGAGQRNLLQRRGGHRVTRAEMLVSSGKVRTPAAPPSGSRSASSWAPTRASSTRPATTRCRRSPPCSALAARSPTGRLSLTRRPEGPAPRQRAVPHAHRATPV
jgi:hypothetical protein